MTLKELSQLYFLKSEIEMHERRLEELRTKLSQPSSPNFSGMPRGSRCEGRLEQYIAEIVDLEAIISAKKIQCLHEQNRLERYIADIPDSLTRQIFTYRFVEFLTWDECAAKIPGANTGKNLSNICYRYIKKSKYNEI